MIEPVALCLRVSITGGFLCVLILGGCSRERQQTRFRASEGLEQASEGLEQASEELEIAESEAELNPLSIEGLRKRVYPEREIELQNAITTDEGLETWKFSYDSDGYTIYGLLEKPASEAPLKGWPVIIVAHGYIPPGVYSTVHNYRAVTRYYASNGFLVLKPDYRGHDRSEGNSGGPTATINYSIDVLNLINQIDSIPDADTDNIFLYGHSMGGEIGLRVLTVSKALRGATLWAAVTKPFPNLYFLRKRDPQEAERHLKSIEALFAPEEYSLLSPNNYFDSIDIPILIHHGTQDESVPFEWSISFREELDEAQVDYTFYQYPGENHNISKSFFKVMDRDMAFFRDLIE